MHNSKAQGHWNIVTCIHATYAWTSASTNEPTLDSLATRPEVDANRLTLSHVRLVQLINTKLMPHRSGQGQLKTLLRALNGEYQKRRMGPLQLK